MPSKSSTPSIYRTDVSALLSAWTKGRLTQNCSAFSSVTRRKVSKAGSSDHDHNQRGTAEVVETTPAAMAEHQTTTITVQKPSDTAQPQHTNNSPSTNGNDQSDHLREPAGTFTLLLFAAASTYTGNDSLMLPAPMTLRQLFDALEEKYAGIKKKVLRSSAITVNLEYVEFEVDADGNLLEEEGVGEVTIGKGDEVGVIPPVSSG